MVVITAHQKRPISFFLQLAGGFLLLTSAFAAAMMLGAAETTLKDVWLALTSPSAEGTAGMLREIRLPREAAALLVGAALGVSGALMQGMTRNPLADPGLLGLTAGANAALALALAFFPSLSYFGLMIVCFIGTTAGALLVLGIAAAKKGGFSPFRLVLAGAAVSFFLTAVAEGIGLAFHISKEVSMWTAGGLIGTTHSQLSIVMPVIAAGLLLAILLSRQLTVLSVSEEVAAGLGQKTVQVKILLFFVVVLLAGAAVALAGNLAFVGLMVPHIVRTMTGPDYRKIVPMSALAGGSFLLVADTLGRTLQAPFETPVAALLAIAGLPFFLLIVQKGGKGFL